MRGQTGPFPVAIAGLVILIALGWLGSGLYSDWLWFQNLQFSSVFLTMLASKILIGLVTAVVFLLVVGVNYYFARRCVKKTLPVTGERGGISFEGITLSAKGAGWVIGAFFAFVALWIGSNASPHWSMILRYFHPKTFGVSDPIFEHDAFPHHWDLDRVDDRRRGWRPS